jgi:hypothetical protein
MSDYVQRRVQFLKAEIVKHEKRIRYFQDHCCHPTKNVTRKHEADVGNWCASDDRYWTECYCDRCQKHWTEKGST